MSKRVLVPIANGSEEIEAVTIIDVLRRAGAEVTVASVGSLQITASRGVKIVADKLIGECRDETYDLIALPGGMPGAENLRDSKELIEIMEKQRDRNGWYAAICAAPAVIFAPRGWLSGRNATCHPNFTEKMMDAIHSSDRVVVDGNCVTSKGPGTALEFALKLVAVLYGDQKADEVAKPMVIR